MNSDSTPDMHAAAPRLWVGVGARGWSGAPPPRSVTQVLVPLDGTPRAARILPAVADLARAHDARVLLLRVARRRDHLFDPQPVTTTTLVASLAGARERLLDVGVDAVALGRFGDPAAEVVACAEERGVDVIALTPGRRTGLRRWLSPSVTDHVLREFRGAVLLVGGAGDGVSLRAGARSGASAT